MVTNVMELMSGGGGVERLSKKISVFLVVSDWQVCLVQFIYRCQHQIRCDTDVVIVANIVQSIHRGISLFHVVTQFNKAPKSAFST